MAEPRWRVILNGKSPDDGGLREAVAQWRDQGVEIDVRVTWEAGDAARYAAEAVEADIGSVIAAGGDGTLSEVAGAIAARPEPADRLPTLALLPLGTANDFAGAAGLPRTAHETLALAARPARLIDILRIDADDGLHWCINLASGGFGTEVTVETDEGLKKVLGGLAYLMTGIARLGRIEPITAALEGPNFSWDGALIALGIGNGRQAGGGQILCPEARIDDGLLDVTIIPELAGEVGSTVGTVLTQGKDAALERIATQTRLPWVELRADQPMTLNLDGEPVQSRRFLIECVPARMRMHLPAECELLKDTSSDRGPDRGAA